VTATSTATPTATPTATLARDRLATALRGGAGSPLTPRQTTVLALLANGYGNAAIARRLGCSEHTVKNVVYELMGRLQARNRAHAVALAVRAGLV
jgi:DNA-binding NarL/FixJ family response regulator